MQGGGVSSKNDTISVRFSDDRRPVLLNFAKLLNLSEAQVLKICFEDMAAMVSQPGEERLPRIVHLLRAAMEYEMSKPSLPLQKLDNALRKGYADGTYKPPGLLSETSSKKQKQGKI